MKLTIKNEVRPRPYIRNTEYGKAKTESTNKQRNKQGIRALLKFRMAALSLGFRTILRKGIRLLMQLIQPLLMLLSQPS